MDVGARPCEEVKADPSNLDPGIRDRVLAFIEAGFCTTDSGDGVSKTGFLAEEVLPFPHLAFTCRAGDLIPFADRAIELAGEGAVVEPSVFKEHGLWRGLIFVYWPSE